MLLNPSVHATDFTNGQCRHRSGFATSVLLSDAVQHKHSLAYFFIERAATCGRVIDDCVPCSQYGCATELPPCRADRRIDNVLGHHTTLCGPHSCEVVAR